MSIEATPQIEEPSAPPPAPEDFSGRNRMARNVLTSWAGHLVFFVAGFIMPRMTDRYLGQEALGVWDFGWSLVSYFGLVQTGISGAVAPYVARYRATGDTLSLNTAVSSAQCVQTGAGVFALSLSAIAALLVPALFSERLGEHVGEASWVVLFLGGSISIQLLLNPFDGVLQGCHRWDIKTLINAGGHALTVCGMLVALLLHGGLISLAAITFCGTLLAEVVRISAAHAVCKGLAVRLRKAKWGVLVEMFAFGGKSLLWPVSRILLYQTNSILIAAFLGPAALAFYSRPRSLVGQTETFMNRFSFVLAPMASALHARDCREDVQRLFLRSLELAIYISLPLVLLLAIMGDVIVRLWMGSRYGPGLLVVILAVGHLTDMVSQPAVSILTGMNRHGRVGLVSLASAVSSAILGFLALAVLGWGLVGAALALTLPLTVTSGVWIPLHFCRVLGVPLRRLLGACLAPVLWSLPLASCLLAARVFLGHSPLLALALGMGTGGVVMGVAYWRHVVPHRLRDRVTDMLGRAVSVCRPSNR
jgi:O-antigen/teichoic acid export membrane protein